MATSKVGLHISSITSGGSLEHWLVAKQVLQVDVLCCWMAHGLQHSFLLLPSLRTIRYCASLTNQRHVGLAGPPGCATTAFVIECPECFISKMTTLL